MNLDPILKRARKLSRPYRVADGKGFRLRDYACDDTGEFGEEDRDQAHEILAEGIAAITELQDRLYAEDRWSLLLVIQAMDAAGKDSTIKHVMSGVNPQGCDVVAFKTPSTTELDHDYLWRVHKEVPSRGKIGIFNRSYYEEVLVVRVHPEFLGAQKLPPDLVGERIWEERYRQIRRFERHLAENGTRTVKFFLHVSRDEQKRLRKAARDAEAELTRLTERRDAIDEAMADPSKSKAELAKLTMGELAKARAELERQIAEAENAWLDASDAMERLAA